MNEKVFINSICGRCVHVDVCSSIKDNRQKCGSYLEQRQHGEWKVRHDTMYHFECPFCKYLHQYKDNFCPNCGADMRLKEGAGNEND